MPFKAEDFLEKDRDEIFNRDSDWLQAVLQQRVEQLAQEADLPLRVAALELGRVAIVMGVTFAGNGIGLPPETSLPIAYDAIHEIGVAAGNHFKRRN